MMVPTMRRSQLLLAILVLVAACARPDGASSSPVASSRRELRDLLERVRHDKHLPALSAAVWKHGELVERATVGRRTALEGSPPATDGDRWHLGSNTKAMTALLIGIHVDRGELRWDDTLAKLFPGEPIHPGYAQVTLEQLLRHRGGMAASPPESAWTQLWADGTTPDARLKFVRDTLAAAPALAPGTMVYSNTGYMVAGAALERVTGARWEDLMQKDLFAPLGITACGFGAPGTPPGQAGATIDQPWGHDASGKPLPPGPGADNPPGVGPAGTVHCTLADYGKFLTVFTDPNQTLVTRATMARLTDPSEGYAGGWIVGEDGKVLAHSGSNTLWYLTAIVVPSRGLAAVVATNKAATGLEDVLNDVAKRHAGAE